MHMAKRLQSIEKGTGIDFATAEALAFGSLMLGGQHVRLCGQDSGRVRPSSPILLHLLILVVGNFLSTPRRCLGSALDSHDCPAAESLDFSPGGNDGNAWDDRGRQLAALRVRRDWVRAGIGVGVADGAADLGGAGVFCGLFTEMRGLMISVQFGDFLDTAQVRSRIYSDGTLLIGLRRSRLTPTLDPVKRSGECRAR